MTSDAVPETDQTTAVESTDLSAMESRLDNAADVPDQEAEIYDASAQSAASNEAAAPSDQPSAPAAAPEKPAEPPPEHVPQRAYGEKGNADRAETGPEKPEVKYFHPGGPERGG